MALSSTQSLTEMRRGHLNAMAQDRNQIIFRRNGRIHLSRWGASVQSNTGNRGVRISGSNAGYTMF